MTAFDNSFLDHDAWLRQAAQFIVAAEVLIGEFNPPRRPHTEESLTTTVGCMKAALLLLAVSVENAFKGVKVAQGKVTVVAGKVNRKSLGGGRSGHDLCVLAAECGIALAPAEQVLLRRLTEIALWAGKYQQPLSSAEYEAAVVENPRQLAPTSDVRMVRGLVAKSTELARAARSA